MMRTIQNRIEKKIMNVVNLSNVEGSSDGED